MSTEERPPSPAGGGGTLGDMLAGGASSEVVRHWLCWRCGAIPGTSSPCTEKRGDGPPWRHAFLDRDLDQPWVDYSDRELLDLARYLAGKSMSSLATAKAFEALVVYGEQLGFDLAQRQSHAFAMHLYAGKATKRIRLLDWAMDALDARSKP